MKMATTHQSMLATHVQPMATGTMLYPGRCSAWQPVVTTMVEVPKESIIANTDFTTTSIIAKRRLSSKKRRLQHQNSLTATDTTTLEGATQTPVSSANGSPAVTSTTHTPPATMDKNEMDNFTHKDTSGFTASVPQSLPNSSYSSHTSTTTSSLSNGMAFGGSGQFISIAPTAITSTHAVNLMQNQLANPAVLSQLQQGLNYRFLQEQSLLRQQTAVGITAVPPSSHIAHPQPLTEPSQRPPSHESTHSESGSRSGFKWCVAHIVIAKQIQFHKEQQNGGTAFPLHPNSSEPPTQSLPPPLNPLCPQNHTHPHPPSSLSLSTSSTQPHLPQPTTTTTVTSTTPMQQHLALMHYNLPSNTAAATGLPPGYLAIPYSSVQELQLRMQQSLVPMPTHPVQFPVVKPVMTLSDSMIGLNPGIQVVGGVPLQQAQLAHLAIGHSNPNAGMMQGSWVTPVPVMNSCVINNPFQPGIMAAPWVK